MILRLAMMGISNLFILGLTGYLFRSLRTKSTHLDLPIFGFIWIFNAMLFTFLFGVFGLLHPVSDVAVKPRRFECDGSSRLPAAR